jgi:hypothetical protein
LVKASLELRNIDVTMGVYYFHGEAGRYAVLFLVGGKVLWYSRA